MKPTQGRAGPHPQMGASNLQSTTRRAFLRDVTVDPEFSKEIIAHYQMNLTGLPWASPIMAVEGPPGEGKTLQLQAIMEQGELPYASLSASQLSGRHEGDSLRPLYEAYEKLSAQCTDDQIGCLIIDDFDLSSAGRRHETSYSVNSQLLTALMMELADDPSKCFEKPVRRHAIFMTGNDFSLIHGPLIRKGRCRLFSWNPCADQKHRIFLSILEKVKVTNAIEITDEIITSYPDIPIATFGAAIEDFAVSQMKKSPLPLQETKPEELKAVVEKALATMTAEVFRSSILRVRTTQPKNYLEPRDA
jgi:ATP-dependent 26S proteasome regulatory subunit